MRRDSKLWLWLLLLLYALYAAYWGEELAALFVNPARNAFHLPVVVGPVFRALIG